MQLLKQRILKDGTVREGKIIKVDSFLNHQVDTVLMDEMGKEFAKRFEGEKITKILTIEASGISIAVMAAKHFGNVPVVFAKKSASKNLNKEELLTAKVHSYTRDVTYDIQVSGRFITKQDKVLILDDFLANGQALLGLIDLLKQAGATLAGCGIVIEKGFQDGGGIVRGTGVRVESLAIIKSIEDGKILFED